MASAAPGEMLVSTMVRDLVAGSNLRFEEMDAGSPGGTPGDPRLCRVCAESDSSTVSQPSPRRAASRTSSRELSLLTRRERQVAVLVGRGLTNRQISHELTIAESTAERHVINILNKLGQHSRVQIATWATGQGLVDTTAD
jgi:DNA-binding NarL/FixJ family response regulator